MRICDYDFEKGDYDLNEPEIGIFIFAGDFFLQRTNKVSNVKTNYLGIKIHKKSHCDDLWNYGIVPKLRNRGFGIPTEYSKCDYDFLPRGRVEYSVEDDTYFVRLDKCINDSEHQELIRRHFILNGKNVIFEIDEFYYCLGCI